MRIEIPLFNDFDEVDAIGPYEVLSNATYAVEDSRSSSSARTGRARSSPPMACGSSATGPRRRGRPRARPGRRLGPRRRRPRRSTRTAAPPALRELADGGAAMASVCTGAMLLAKAGITDGRPATTHRGALDDLARAGRRRRPRGARGRRRRPDDLRRRHVRLDLAFHLVEREWGAELAGSIATLMEHEPSARSRSTACTDMS